MSLLRKESVQAMSDAFGFSDLPDEILGQLTGDLEYRLRELTQEAAKFTRHSKRRRLSTNDVNMALRLRNLEPLYGYAAPVTPVVGEKDAKLFRRVDVGNDDLFYTPDEVVDLATFIKCPLPKCPVDVTFTSHWLAVEGVQPAIPQNPPVVHEEEDVANQSQDTPAAAAATAATAADVPQGGGGGGGGGAPKPGATPGAARAKPTSVVRTGVEVKNIVKHELSREQQLYYKSVTEGLLDTDEAYIAHLIEVVSEDPGLHQLLPYFIQFIAEKVTANLGKLKVLTVLITFCNALLENPSLYPEPYLHQILPAVLTCIVGKSLCTNPDEDHWSLRRLAAGVVKTICAKFGSHGRTETRITKTMISALLDAKKPLATHFGAVVTLSSLGPNVLDAILIDSMEAYYRFLAPQLKHKDRRTKADAAEVDKALLEACGEYLAWQQKQNAAGAGVTSPLPDPDSGQRYGVLSEIFGQRLQPYLP